MGGWISLHRKFIDWEWFDDDKMVKLFIYLLLKANHEQNEWRGIKIERGQLITGLKSLSDNTKLTIQNLRTCLNKLKKTKEINIKTTNKYSIITICNYDNYQNNMTVTNKQTNKRLTNNQQTTNKQLTTNNNDNNENNIIEREKQFIEELKKYEDKYDKEMLKDFYRYWSEKTKNSDKMKFEKQNTWEISKRLVTWKRNDKKFNR